MDPDIFSHLNNLSVSKKSNEMNKFRFVLQERRLAAIRELVRLLKTGGQALIYVWAFEQEHNKQRSKYLKEQSKEKYSMPLEDTHHVENVQCVSKQSGAKLSVHTNRTAFKTQDLLVPWHLKDEKTQRGEYSVENVEKKKKDGDKASSGHGPCSVNRSESKPGSGFGSSLGIGSEPRTSPGSESERSLPVYHRYYHLFQQGELQQLCGQIPGVDVQHGYHDQGNWCVILEKTA